MRWRRRARAPGRTDRGVLLRANHRISTLWCCIVIQCTFMLNCAAHFCIESLYNPKKRRGRGGARARGKAARPPVRSEAAAYRERGRRLGCSILVLVLALAVPARPSMLVPLSVLPSLCVCPCCLGCLWYFCPCLFVLVLNALVALVDCRSRDGIIFKIHLYFYQYSRSVPLPY